MKEIIKSSKEPPKSRVVPPGVIERYREKIESMADDVKSIMEQEKAERLVCIWACLVSLCVCCVCGVCVCEGEYQELQGAPHVLGCAPRCD